MTVAPTATATSPLRYSISVRRPFNTWASSDHSGVGSGVSRRAVKRAVCAAAWAATRAVWAVARAGAWAPERVLAVLRGLSDILQQRGLAGLRGDRSLAVDETVTLLHSTSPFRRGINSDGEGMAAKCQ